MLVKFRLRSLLLSVIVLVGLLALATPFAYAAEPMVTSESCIKLIKEFEGFASKPYFDYSQWSVGYGNACEKDDYPNGITREQADQLMRAHVVKLESNLNKFLQERKVKLNQNQFDALISFSYNVGSNWMYGDGQVITKAIVDGAVGNDFLFAISRWCLVTDNGVTKINQSLLNRRLIEANLYLNGVYVNSVPSNYRYVFFEDNMEGCINSERVQGYDNSVTDVIRAVPSKSGYVFLGWYTKAEGGQWVSHVGPDTNVKTLYAHWQLGTDGTAGVTAEYVRYGTGAKIYGYPSFNSTVVGKFAQNESAWIIADYMDINGVKWGKIAMGKWVCLSETLAAPGAEGMEPITVKVTNEYVNVRTGPGTGYGQAGTLYKDQEIVLTEVQRNGTYKWGKCSIGWICLDYTDYDAVLAGSSGSTSGEYMEGASGTDSNDTIIAKGAVVKCTSLRVRAGAGMGFATVDVLYTDDQVEIYEIVNVKGMSWGRIDKGWICMSYVKLESSENSTSAAAGTVINCNNLNVRVAPGTSSAKICTLPKGTEVTVYEQTMHKGEKWGRIEQGWVHMDYIYLGGKPPVDVENAGYATGKVVGTDVLRVRSAPGVKNPQVGTLNRDTIVIITETTKVGTTTWGKIDQGWISLDYVQLDGKTVPVDAVAKTVNTKSLRIRAGAGTNYDCIGSYTMGQQVVITEQIMVHGRPWGRTDRGWICLEYVI